MRYAAKMTPFRAAWAFVALLAITAVSGCGYHLRGVTSLEPAYQRVYVEGMGTSDPVYRQLALQFENTNSQLVSNPANATAILVIDSNRVDRRVSVVSAQATIREYELVHRLVWHVRLPDGKTSAKRIIRQARNYNYDPTGVLASSGNEAQVRADLAENVGRLLFYGLRAPIKADDSSGGDSGR